MAVYIGGVYKQGESISHLANVELNSISEKDLKINDLHKNIFSVVKGDSLSRISQFSDENLFVLIEGRASLNGDDASKAKLAEIIAKEYRKNGDSFLSIIKGPFSLVVFSKPENKVILAVDKMGIRPLFYCVANVALLFGSRLDLLKKHPEVGGEVDAQSVYRYLYFSMIPSPYSFIQNIKKLEPGEKVIIQNGNVTRDYYWHPNFNEQNTDIDALKNEVFTSLEQAISAQKTEKCASFLSGGLDSSTVTGLFQKVSEKQIPAYSMGFDAEGYDEVSFARVAAKRYGVEHRVYYVTPSDVLEALPKIAQAYDEPFGNSSVVPTYCCAKVAASDGITTMLAGDGGDELFAGNERYVKQKRFEKYFNLPGFFRHALLEPTLNRFPIGDSIGLIKKGKSYIRQANTPLPDRLQTYNIFHQNTPASILSAEFVAELDEQEPLEILRKRYNFFNDISSLNKMMWLDWKQTLADNDLRKVNVMCELAGIDVRYPMLEDKVIDVSIRIPSRVKVPDSSLRDFYKKTFKDFLPTEIINKPKQGFGLPFGIWMKDHTGLNAYAYDAISDFKKRNVVNVKYIDKLLDNHKNVHPAYYGEQIWVYMMLETWLQQHEIRLSF